MSKPISIPVTLAILKAREGGWDYRLTSIDTDAISFVSPRPYSTPDQARTGADECIANFNSTKFLIPMRMFISPSASSVLSAVK